MKCFEQKVKFTVDDYKVNEDNNYHTENTLELVKIYGTKKELSIMKKIAANHKKNNSISDKDYDTRHIIQTKYENKFFKDEACKECNKR